MFILDMNCVIMLHSQNRAVLEKERRRGNEGKRESERIICGSYRMNEKTGRYKKIQYSRVTESEAALFISCDLISASGHCHRSSYLHLSQEPSVKSSLHPSSLSNSAEKYRGSGEGGHKEVSC